MEIGTPDVLKDPDTEPEAAHLRNVLRRIKQIADHDDSDVLKTVVGLCRDALKRPYTNGEVIDQLTKENGDLQSMILNLRSGLPVATAVPLVPPPLPPSALEDLERRVSALELSAHACNKCGHFKHLSGSCFAENGNGQGCPCLGDKNG